jgi:hypothetical protein
VKVHYIGAKVDYISVKVRSSGAEVTISGAKATPGRLGIIKAPFFKLLLRFAIGCGP